MSELGIQDPRHGFGARDISPDSVIFAADSNFSLYSSASGSVDRCSFASDAHDHEASFRAASRTTLAEHGFHGSSGGPALDPIKHIVHRNSHLSRKEKSKVHEATNSIAETEDEGLAVDLAATSFSQALKECQDRRLRSELKTLDRQRPASLDMKHAANSSSPRYGLMKKPSVTTQQTSAFSSPETPNYCHSSVGAQKDRSSVQVPLHTSANRRQVNTTFLPYNNGRALPFKWVDAERWIFSPVSRDGDIRTSLQQPQMRPKSKSGPLGPPGSALYSPIVPVSKGGNDFDLQASSPFSTRVMSADGLSVQYGGHEIRGKLAACCDLCMTRSISVHGSSEIFCLSSFPAPQGESECAKGVDANIPHFVSRKDMATQMRPKASPQSSPMRCSLSPTEQPSIQPIMEVQSVLSSKADIRNVLVDEQVTLTRWRKKHKVRIPQGSLDIVDYRKSKPVGTHSGVREVLETAHSLSKVKKEEARITAWENLQKAKAEAEIQKLEMKLQKKRSSSMDKIMNKLRSAQKKAQEMRSSAVARQSHDVVRISHRALFFRQTHQMGSFSGCFTCHEF
nr:Remorin, C-terminal protein [Ipomoea batatas]